MKQSKDKSLLSLPIDNFLSRVGERQPAPGGGAAAAVTAALAVATARMVAAYSTDRKTPPDRRDQLDELGRQLARLEQICHRLIDEDAVAYRNYAETSRKIKSGELPSQELQPVVQLVISVPLELTAVSVGLLRLLDGHKEALKSTLFSDLAVSTHLAVAACRAARETAWCNVFELDRQDDRTHIYEQLDHFVGVAGTLAEGIVSFVHR